MEIRLERNPDATPMTMLNMDIAKTIETA